MQDTDVQIHDLNKEFAKKVCVNSVYSFTFLYNKHLRQLEQKIFSKIAFFCVRVLALVAWGELWCIKGITKIDQIVRNFKDFGFCSGEIQDYYIQS
jgi:hypothetical protein